VTKLICMCVQRRDEMAGRPLACGRIHSTREPHFRNWEYVGTLGSDHSAQVHFALFFKATPFFKCLFQFFQRELEFSVIAYFLQTLLALDVLRFPRFSCLQINPTMNGRDNIISHFIFWYHHPQPDWQRINSVLNSSAHTVVGKLLG